MRIVPLDDGVGAHWRAARPFAAVMDDWRHACYLGWVRTDTLKAEWCWLATADNALETPLFPALWFQLG